MVSHDMSDLRSEMQELKSEKRCLITTLKLLQSDFTQTDTRPIQHKA